MPFGIWQISQKLIDHIIFNDIYLQELFYFIYKKKKHYSLKHLLGN